MPRQIVFTQHAAKPQPMYSQAVKAAGLIFVSGTAPADPVTGAFVDGGAGAQTAQCLRNIQAILEAAGSSLDKAVSATIILAEGDDFSAVNAEWMKWFPKDPPARQAAKLPVKIPGLLVSIAMVAEA
jgi:2-iminobutanoate/2-iminopropanoate deaminase